MSILTICEAIKNIGAKVDGIETAFSEPPVKLDTAELPALYPFTGPAVYDGEVEGDDGLIVTRQYRVHVATSMKGQDDEIAAEQNGKTLLEAVVLRFANRPSLANTAGVIEAKVLSDTGVIILPEYSGKVIGFEVVVQVSEYVIREIVDYDF